MAKSKAKLQPEAPVVAAVEEPRYSKVALLQSKKFRHLRDVINALLDENKTYTIEEAEALIGRFMKGKVN